MKTLYVSDLDGTLLRSDETTSEYTNSVINNLTDRGMIFSYATAVISSKLKEISNYQAKSNDEDGVAHWLEDNYIVK